MPRPLVLAPLAALVLAVLLAGCGLFEPRDPEKPTPNQVTCINRSKADSVEATIQVSYGSSSGITCYTGALDATFAFHPDPTDSLQSDPSIFANWNRDVEARVARDLAADAIFALAVFDSEYATRTISPDGRTEIRYYAYHVLTQSKSGTTQPRYQGLADITYQQGTDALWRIVSWVDKRDNSGTTYQTWGLLRRNYRVGF